MQYNKNIVSDNLSKKYNENNWEYVNLNFKKQLKLNLYIIDIKSDWRGQKSVWFWIQTIESGDTI